jgi:hypothetical protein
MNLPPNSVAELDQWLAEMRATGTKLVDHLVRVLDEHDGDMGKAAVAEYPGAIAAAVISNPLGPITTALYLGLLLAEQKRASR